MVTRTLVVAVVTVTDKLVAVAPEFVDNLAAPLGTICIRDDIPVGRDGGKLNRSPTIGSLPAAALIGVHVLASKTVSVPAVGLSEPLDVDSRGRGGEGKNDGVTHFYARLMT